MSLSRSSRRRHALSFVRRAIHRTDPTKAELESYAAELDIEPQGTGADGAVTKQDLLRALTGEPSPEPTETSQEELTDG